MVCFRNGLEFRYENIAEAINLKRIEVDTLVSEFERKVRKKEVRNTSKFIVEVYLFTTL